MNGSQNYGVLRVIRGSHQKPIRERRLPFPSFPKKVSPAHEHTQNGWVPEARFVYLLTRRETTIGRALSSDLMLLDPTVSREHARLVLDEHGWHIYNLTEQNTVSVNDTPVPAGTCSPIRPQDFLLLGSMVLQLVAPHANETALPIAESDQQPPPAQPASVNGHLQYASPLHLEQEALPSSPPETVNETLPLDAPAHAEGREHPKHFLDNRLTMHFSLTHRLNKRARWLIALVAVSLSILVALAGITIVQNNLGWLSVLAQDGPLNVVGVLTLPIIPALGIHLLVNFIDRFEREPWFLRLAAFLWGAIIATPPAIFLEQFVNTALIPPEVSLALEALLKGLNAGVTEEVFKGLGLLLLFFLLRDEFDNITDGIIYGALIGAGFALSENFIYFIHAENDLVLLIDARIVLGWLSHSTFTICFGIALGSIRHNRVRWQQIVIPLLGFFLAVCLHTSFDFINLFIASHPGKTTITTLSLAALIGSYIPPFIAQIIILYLLMKSLAHEATVIREFLITEVSNGIVTVDEYAILHHSFARTKAERSVLRRFGFKQWLRVKALYQAEIGLAFRKWHVSLGDRPKPGTTQPEDAYRQRIKRLRAEIAAAEKTS